MNLFENLQLMRENENNKPKQNGREFFKKVNNARETLTNFSKDKVDFVKKAYDEVLADIGDAFVSERGNNSSKIKNDYISIGIENDILTVEEFETIYNAFLVIGTFESHAHA